MAGTDHWQFKPRWWLPGEIPHLARLVEAVGLTQSAHNGWLQHNSKPLTRASTAAIITGEVKCNQQQPNFCEYLAKELMSPSEAAVHKAAWPKGQKPWMAVDPGEKTLLTVELFTEVMVYLLQLGNRSLALLYPHQLELDLA